jgi:L-threonylcarbamoyladenylate synthase
MSKITTDIELAAHALASGKLVAFPTETVYGLGADATNPVAVARIYAVKGRPLNHPLIVHIPSADFLTSWAKDTPRYALQLADSFWPGPMTLILKRTELAKDFITGSQDSVGVRVPSHPVSQELLARFTELGGKGVAAPSANKFGRVSTTSSVAVMEDLAGSMQEGDLILEGADSDIGIESTIIDCTGSTPAILRPGAITSDMIRKVTGLEVSEGDSRVRVSGSMDKHYSPIAKVVLDELAQPGDGLIAMSDVVTPQGVIRLCEPRTVEEYASVLYSSLRLADQLKLTRVVAISPSGDGLALAIRNRLAKASAE